jgi:hypothetical protein
MNLGVLFEVLAQGLRLWNEKESNKYLDQVLELQRRWKEEYEKPRDKRSNAVLDECEHELFLISKIFIAPLRK